MRSAKSIKNVLVTWAGLFFVSMGGFVVRIVLARVMAEEYLGLNGLFGNIISVLSLAELGVGPAITFSLYRPIAENDTKQITALMQLYRKFYIGVGLFVLVVGTALTPFLPYLIKDMPQNVEHIYFIYFLYVLNSSLSYFYSYKIVYVSANQNYYLYSMNHAICYVCMYAMQVIVLALTKNFIVFYTIQVITTALENLNISRIADKRYPILKSKEQYELPVETVKTIKTNVFAAIGHNIGNVVLNSTDNIIISKFVGLVETGMYSNYLLVTSTVNMFLNQAFSAVMSSIGNLGVEGTEEQKEDSFYLVYFANFWIYCFASIAILVLASPFISLAFGDNYVMNFAVVAIIGLNFFATGMRQTCITFKSAYGILIQDVHKAYIEAIVNLVVSVILVQNFGVFGVLLGTLISNYAVAFWIEPKVLFKYGLHKKPWKYFGIYVLYMLTYMIGAAVTYGVSLCVRGNGIVSFLFEVVVVLIVPNIIILFLWWRNPSCKQLINIVRTIMSQKMNKTGETHV